MEKKKVTKKSDIVNTPYYDKSGDLVEGEIDSSKLKVVKGKDFPVER